MSRKPSVLFLSLVLGILVSSAAFADEGQKQESDAYDLGEVVVRGKSGGVEATGKVLEVTEQDISDTRAHNLAEAIEHLPGIHVFTGGRGVPRISIRGFRPRQVLLLLNGIPMNASYDQQFDPTAIPTENMAEIKVTEGTSSVLYGPGGNGGVINIITKKGTEGVRGMVGAEYGQGNSHLEKAIVSGGTKKLDLFFSGSNYKTDGFLLSDDYTPVAEQPKGLRVNSDVERQSLFANAGYSVSDSLNLGLTANYSRGSYGIPTATLNPPDLFSLGPKWERVDDFENLNLQLAGDCRPSDSFGVRGWVYRNQNIQHDNRYDNGSFTSFDNPLAQGSFKFEHKVNITGAMLQPRVLMGDKATLTVGVSTESDDWESRGSIKDQFGGWPPINYYRRVDAERSFTLFGVMSELEYSPIPKLGFVAGYGHHWQNREDISDDDQAYLLGAHYDVTNSTRLKAAYQQSIRFPDLRQLYDEEMGNRALKTERTIHYTAGVEQKLPWTNTLVGIDGFYSIANNFIKRDRLDTGIFQNYDQYTFTGFEVASTIGFIRNLLLRPSYSLLHAEDHATRGMDELEYRPEHRVTMLARYAFDFGFTVNLAMRYVGEQVYYSKGEVAPGVYLKRTMDDYAVVDLKFSQTLPMWQKRVSLYVGADNILDRDYEETYSLPRPGRFIFGGMEVRF